MINPIMKNHASLSDIYGNNRKTNESVITHQNHDMTVYRKQTTYISINKRIHMRHHTFSPHNSFYFKMIYWSISKDVISVTICDFKVNLLYLWNISHRDQK